MKIQSIPSSAKARSAIRHYLKHQRHHQSVTLGKRMLSRALAENHIDLEHMSDEQQPYVPAESTMAELTVKAVVLGVVLAAIMGAANAYLALKAGQTVSATFPSLEGELARKDGANAMPNAVRSKSCARRK